MHNCLLSDLLTWSFEGNSKTFICLVPLQTEAIYRQTILFSYYFILVKGHKLFF